MLHKKISRKTFFKHCLSGLIALAYGAAFLKPVLAATQNKAFNGRPKRSPVTDHDLVAVKGEDPYAMMVKAVRALGGMEKFVRIVEVDQENRIVARDAHAPQTGLPLGVCAECGGWRAQ